MYTISLNQVRALMLFSCPCVFPDGERSSCRKESPWRCFVQKCHYHRRRDRETAKSSGSGLNAFFVLMSTLETYVTLTLIDTDSFKYFFIRSSAVGVAQGAPTHTHTHTY